MSSAELTEWLAFYTIEPFGEDTQYLGHAITASTIANVNRGKHGKRYKPDDFMPKFKAKKQTTQEQIAFAAALTQALGGEDKRTK